MTQFIKKMSENMYNVFAETANIEIYEKKIFTPASKIIFRFFCSSALALTKKLGH